MALLLNAFPKLTKDLFEKIEYSPAVYSFSYRYGGETRRLEKTVEGSPVQRMAKIQLTDSICYWHPETSNLIINLSCCINAPEFLFGESGLAAKNGGAIGVALMWKAPNANQRGVKSIAKITSRTSGPFKINGQLIFSPKKLRGDLILQTIFYLESAGIPQGLEKYQAVEVGTVLGVLDNSKVIIDGNGSIFPICEISDSKEPLWKVSCEWINPLVDSFTEDHFCLYLNNAHEDFATLNLNGGKSPLFMEIYASALQILIMKVLNDDEARESTRIGSEIESGSISAVVNYLIHTLGIAYDYESPEALAVRLRKSIMEKM